MNAFARFDDRDVRNIESGRCFNCEAAVDYAEERRCPRCEELLTPARTVAGLPADEND